MNRSPTWKRIFVILNEVLILLAGLFAALVLWLWFQDGGGFEAIYVAVGAVLAGLLIARRWLRQEETEAGAKAAVFSQLAKWRQAVPAAELSTLRQQIESHFNLDELNILASDLGFTYENLAGETRTRKTHSLVETCQRHGRLSELIIHLRQNRPHVLWIEPITQPLAMQAKRLREKLLNSVKTVWIEGVLQQSIHTEILKLTMSFRPGVTEQRAWQLVLKQKGLENQVVSPERSLLDIFDKSGRNLLILGEPGSGKTTTMLQIADALIAEAYQDPAVPIPLVLNLSSWAQGQIELTEWLAEEVFIQYGLARDLGRAGVKQNQFLYLFDGLDEILDSQDREACIEAINEFKAKNVADMIVCSRTTEYEVLSNQIVTGAAVQIQPLNEEQVAIYLSHEGLEMQAVRAMLASDQGLRELAQTPLMLGLMTLAYKGLSREELEPLADKEARRRHLFNHYVAQMFARRPLPAGSEYSPKEAITWLSNLAQVMIQQGQMIFHLERLQPTWLNVSHWYYLLARIIVGLGSGLIMGLTTGLITGLLAGWVVDQGFEIFGAAALTLIIGLFTGLLAAVIIAGVFVFGEQSVVLVDEVRWHIPSKQGVWTVIIRTLATVLLTGLSIGFLVAPVDGFIFGSSFGLFVGLLTLLNSCISKREFIERTQPNEGVHNSARNGIRMSLIVGYPAGFGFTLIIMLLFTMSDGSFIGALLGLSFGVCFGMTIGISFGFLRYGGQALWQHHILRWLMSRVGILPYPFQDDDLIAFFDTMSERILLRRVGNGWMFVHRALLEYFASLKPFNSL